MKTKYIVSICASILLLVSVWYIVRASSEISIDQNVYYPVTYVVDGDTFKVLIGGKGITVRMLGINTPETVDPRKAPECFGHEASDETKRLLGGRKVQLHFNPHRELKDKYGRYLAYAYRDDGLFVNEELLKQGFAREYTFGTAYSFQREFRNIEVVAQKENRGLWGMCGDTAKRLEKSHD